MPRPNSGSWPTRRKFDEVPGVPPPGPTVVSPRAIWGMVSTTRSAASAAIERRFMGFHPFSCTLNRMGWTGAPPTPCGWLPLLADGEFLGLGVEVAELAGAGGGAVAEVPDQQPAGDVGLVDAAVVPVVRPVAAQDELGL